MSKGSYTGRFQNSPRPRQASFSTPAGGSYDERLARAVALHWQVDPASFRSFGFDSHGFHNLRAYGPVPGRV